MSDHRLPTVWLGSCSLLLLATSAFATDYYASPTGGGNGSSPDSPMTLTQASSQAGAGDTVYLRDGTYSQGLTPMNSGNAGAWITFEAYPGELPIIQAGGTGVGSSSAQYIRFVGIVSRNNSSMGFSNGYSDHCGSPQNGHMQFVNVIAEGNGISGIAFFCATDVLIEQAIVAHNGLGSSWSSGVNLYGVTGGVNAATVRRVVSFENIDISSAMSDGSGFITDIQSQGARFENCIGFRNGGSCFRVTLSQNAHIFNSTCWENGQYDNYGDEIFFSNQGDANGAVVRNNILVPSSGNGAIGWTTTGATIDTNLQLSGGAAAPFFESTSGRLDFRIVAGSSNVIDQGSTTDTPTDQIGFDPMCLKPADGSESYPVCGSTNSCTSKIGWFAYAIDYDYIRSVGGVAGCFQGGARDGSPDLGAYEFGADTGTGTGVDTGTGTGVDTGTGTGVDTGTGTGVDTGTGTGVDTGTGTGVDTGTGTGVDTGTGTGVDTGTDTGVDTGTETGVDTGTDTGVDTGTDTGVDTDTDTGVDTGTDTGASTGSATGVGTGTGTGANTGSATGVGTGTGTGANTGTGSGTGTGASTGTDTGIGTGCSLPLTRCGDVCVDTTSDATNCGYCGQICQAGQVCSLGTCTLTCEATYTLCGQSCVDLLSSVTNCGGCGYVCAQQQTCQAGVCVGAPGPGSATDPTVDVTADSTDGPDDESGCGCSVPGSKHSPNGWFALLGAALSALLAIRRARAARSAPGRM